MGVRVSGFARMLGGKLETTSPAESKISVSGNTPSGKHSRLRLIKQIRCSLDADSLTCAAALSDRKERLFFFFERLTLSCTEEPAWNTELLAGLSFNVGAKRLKKKKKTT